MLWRRGAETGPLVPEFWIMENQFFNPSVRHVYRLGPKTYYESFLPTVPVRARGDGVLIDQGGREISPRYLLVTCRTPVEGRQVARGTAGVLQLLDVGGRVRLVSGSRCSRSSRVHG